MGKLTRAHVYLIGAGLALVVGVTLVLVLVRPVAAELRTAETSLNQVKAEADSKQNAAEVLEATRALEARFTGELQAALRRKNSPAIRLNLGDRSTATKLGLLGDWWELPRRVVPLADRYAINNPNNVSVTANFGAPVPGVQPQDIPDDVVVWNLGQMTARGSFRNVLAWVRRWNDFPLVVAVDGLRLDRAEQPARDQPEVVATCNLTVYIMMAPERAGSGVGGGAAAAAPAAAAVGDGETDGETID